MVPRLRGDDRVTKPFWKTKRRRCFVPGPRAMKPGRARSSDVVNGGRKFRDRGHIPFPTARFVRFPLRIQYIVNTYCVRPRRARTRFPRKGKIIKKKKTNRNERSRISTVSEHDRPVSWTLRDSVLL